MIPRLPKICTQLVKCIYIGISLYILIIVTTTSPSSLFLTIKPFLFPNLVLLTAFVLLVVAIFSLGFLPTNLFHHTPPQSNCTILDKLVLQLTLFAIPIQFYLTCNYYFRTGWDVGALDAGADALLLGNADSVSSYLSIYPNNILLFLVMSICKRLDALFGIISPSNGILPFILLNCVISSVTGWLTYQNVLNFCTHRWAIIGFVLYWGLVGISPWVGIPYSDSLALAFPSLILFLYTHNFTPILKWNLIGFLSGIAYNIKPQSFLIFIAIVIITFFHSKFSDLCKNSVVCIIFILSFFVSLLFPKFLLSTMGITLDSNQSFGSAHFLMMGVNPRTHGYYASEDIDFSSSFSNKGDRNRANLQIFLQRMKNYGFAGYLNVLHDKTAYTYNDGTFAWSVEGNFWDTIYPMENNFISPAIRSFYYTDGSNYSIWCTWAQFLWLATLLFSSFSVLSKQHSKSLSVLQLTLCGLFIFEMLFEVRARYIYTCAPLFIVLAVIGLRNIYQFIQLRLKHISNNLFIEVK